MNHEAETLTVLLDSCLACGSPLLEPFADFGDQPLANSYVNFQGEREMMFPLGLNFCWNCSHVQLTHSVLPDVMFGHYLYVSGTTRSLDLNFMQLAIKLMLEYDPRSVLDIGGNDGSFLRKFKDEDPNIECVNVDPAENLRCLSEAKGLATVNAYWTEDINLGRKFDLITGLNVFAHNRNPLGFLRAATRHLTGGGRIVLQFPYAAKTFAEYPDFGQVYHEHLSYFNVKSMTFLADRAGLVIDDIMESPIHGGSIIFVLRKGLTHCSKAQVYITEEGRLELNTLRRYCQWMQQVQSNVWELNAKLKEFSSVVAYGASAKSSLLFNFPGVGRMIAKKIQYVIDDNLLKVNKFTPGANIKIVSIADVDSNLASHINVLLTVHNFKEEVKTRLKGRGLSGTMINYVPNVSVEEF